MKDGGGHMNSGFHIVMDNICSPFDLCLVPRLTYISIIVKYCEMIVSYIMQYLSGNETSLAWGRPYKLLNYTCCCITSDDVAI